MELIPTLGVAELMQAKRILAVQPHYDDNDIAVGGTLHTLANTGAEIIYLTVTDDRTGIINTDWGIAEADRRLQEDQLKAGLSIGIRKQIRLGFPDAGSYDYFSLRKMIIQNILVTKPDFIFCVDPWSPYEAHTDHILTGKATAEAAILYSLPKILLAENADLGDYQLQGVVFYNTAYPNLVFDITEAMQSKQDALRAYRAQFNQQDLEDLVIKTTYLSTYTARQQVFKFGEALKIIEPWMLHGVPLTKQ